MNDLDDFVMTRPATALRPLLGLTVLAVEDSRYASEALRLLCLRSGARIRRADSLAAAERHLRVYRPSVVIVDVGLPDGDGLALIATLAARRPRIGVILASSGDADLADAALAQGADGFLAKPLSRLAEFQAAILAHLPADRQPPGLRIISEEEVGPDRLAYRDDLQIASAALSARGEGATRYLSQFLVSLARSAGDLELEEAAGAVARSRSSGLPPASEVARLSALVTARLHAAGEI